MSNKYYAQSETSIQCMRQEIKELTRRGCKKTRRRNE